MSYKLVNPYTNIEFSSNKNKLESAQEIWSNFSKNTKNYVSDSYFTLQKGGKYHHFNINEKLNSNNKIAYTITEFNNHANDSLLKKQLNSQKGAGKHKYSKSHRSRKSSFSSSDSSESSLSDSSDDSSSSSSLSSNSSSSSTSSNSPYLGKNKNGIVYKFKNRDNSTYVNLNKVIYYDIYGLKYIIPTFKNGVEIIFTVPP